MISKTNAGESCDSRMMSIYAIFTSPTCFPFNVLFLRTLTFSWSNLYRISRNYNRNVQFRWQLSYKPDIVYLLKHTLQGGPPVCSTLWHKIHILTKMSYPRLSLYIPIYRSRLYLFTVFNKQLPRTAHWVQAANSKNRDEAEVNSLTKLRWVELIFNHIGESLLYPINGVDFLTVRKRTHESLVVTNRISVWW